ncbi:CBS domain-containing protein [Providencia manganoxydans]|uniref:CBS domain-containing protein n=1 Tax=Providencia manganoxydans TaxID=2923283 RepID=UPI0034E3DBA1
MSYCWKNVLINTENTIREALEIINNEALRVALVINEEQRLVGIVTDGDIRRGLLNNLQLSDPISLIMNQSPTTAKIGSCIQSGD